jgi:hypothetical protein
VLLARAIVLRAISLLSIKCVPLSSLAFSYPGLYFCSESASLAAGLECLGLANVQLVVKLMRLCASDANLGCLSAAIGALVQSNPSAHRLLVQLCTQVSYCTL